MASWENRSLIPAGATNDEIEIALEGLLAGSQFMHPRLFVLPVPVTEIDQGPPSWEEHARTLSCPGLFSTNQADIFFFLFVLSLRKFQPVSVRFRFPFTITFWKEWRQVAVRKVECIHQPKGLMHCGFVIMGWTWNTKEYLSLKMVQLHIT